MVCGKKKGRSRRIFLKIQMKHNQYYTLHRFRKHTFSFLFACIALIQSSWMVLLLLPSFSCATSSPLPSPRPLILLLPWMWEGKRRKSQLKTSVCFFFTTSFVWQNLITLIILDPKDNVVYKVKARWHKATLVMTVSELRKMFPYRSISTNLESWEKHRNRRKILQIVLYVLIIKRYQPVCIFWYGLTQHHRRLQKVIQWIALYKYNISDHSISVFFSLHSYMTTNCS